MPDLLKIGQEITDFCTKHAAIPDCRNAAAPIIERVVDNCTLGYPGDDQVVQRETCIDRESVVRNKTLIDKYYPAGAGSTPTPQPQPAASAPGAAAPVVVAPAPTGDAYMDCLREVGFTNPNAEKLCAPKAQGGGADATEGYWRKKRDDDAAAADPAATTGGGSGPFIEFSLDGSYWNLDSEKAFCLPTAGEKACRASHDPYPVVPTLGLGYYVSEKVALVAHAGLMIAPGFDREGTSVSWSYLGRLRVGVLVQMAESLRILLEGEAVVIPKSSHLSATYPSNPTPLGGRAEIRYYLDKFFCGAHVGGLTTPGNTPDSTGVNNPVGGWYAGLTCGVGNN